MNTISGLFYGLDPSLVKQLVAANALVACGWLSWSLFGARISLSDWDTPRNKLLPVWVVVFNLGLVLALG